MKKKFSENLFIDDEGHSLPRDNRMTCELAIELIEKVKGPILVDIVPFTVDDEYALSFGIDDIRITAPAHFLVYVGMDRDEISQQNRAIEKGLIGDFYRNELISFIKEIPETVHVRLDISVDVMTPLNISEHILKNLDGRKQKGVYFPIDYEFGYCANIYNGELHFSIPTELLELYVIRCGYFPPFSQKDLRKVLINLIAEERKVIELKIVDK